MAIELGEVREKMAQDCWTKAEKIANEHADEDKPFYILYHAKPDGNLNGQIINGKVAAGGIRETWKLCYERPAFILGVLCWYVDNKEGKFEFVSELSSSPDIPVNPSLLSENPQDCLAGQVDRKKFGNIPLIS